MKKVTLNFWALEKPVVAIAENVSFQPGWVNLLQVGQAGSSLTFIPAGNLFLGHMEDFVPPAPAPAPQSEPASQDEPAPEADGEAEPASDATPQAEVPSEA